MICIKAGEPWTMVQVLENEGEENRNSLDLISRVSNNFCFILFYYSLKQTSLSFFFWVHSAACRISVPQPCELGPQQWKCTVLTTGPPGKSQTSLPNGAHLLPSIVMFIISTIKDIRLYLIKKTSKPKHSKETLETTVAIYLSPCLKI